ncbi:hypothetical protein E3E12_02430 [Formicincola oecophyllae]|uniref:Lipoprotein n=2 Tax=Formicincola oecophyllae TaxID=2558361 RepID=A0A4Y6UCL7_9PROT|nr:hypothetical protein E3E12_02430 [Formicincola oecophyllae]
MAIGLSGCGFKPLYGQAAVTSNGQPSTVQQEMSKIYVANIGEHFGQVMRAALQQSMGGDKPAVTDAYTLYATGGVTYETLDIHQDNTSGRMRMMGWADWKLYTVGANPRFLAEGNATTLDGFNPTLDQVFAETLNSETAANRVAQNLAAAINQQVAVYFRSHLAPGPRTTMKPGTYINVEGTPGNPNANEQDLGIDGFPAAATGRSNGNGFNQSDIFTGNHLPAGGPSSAPGYGVGPQPGPVEEGIEP